MFFILLGTLLVILFYLGYKAVRSSEIEISKIVQWSVLFSFLMALSIPGNSSDLYGYISRGAQQTLFHQNPYCETVNLIPDYNKNPLFVNFMWPFMPTSYGPVFIYLTKLIVFLSNNNFLSSFINFKFLNLTLFLYLVLFLLKDNKPENVYLIAWNPFILIQGLWNCHNDLIAAGLILIGLSLFLKENYFWGIFCLTVAVGVKYLAILLIPVLFLYILRSKGKHIGLPLLGFLSGILLIAIFSADYLFSLKNISPQLIENISLSHKSFANCLFTLVKYFSFWQNLNLDLNLVNKIIRCFLYASFGLFYIYILTRKKSDLISDIALLIFIFLSFVTAKFHSWYLLNLIMLLPLLKDGLLKNIFIVLSMSHTFAITFLDQAKILNFISMTLLPVLFVMFRRKK